MDSVKVDQVYTFTSIKIRRDVCIQFTGSVFFELLIMIIILVIIFYYLFLRSNDREEWEELGPFSSIVRYLCFGGAVSYFGRLIFEVEWLYWITLYSAFGILVIERGLKRVKKIVIVVCILFLLSIYRVPTEDSFQIISAVKICISVCMITSV